MRIVSAQIGMTAESALVLVTTSFPIKGDGSEAAGSFVGDMVEAIAEHVPVRVVAPGATSVREAWSGQVDVFRYASPGKPLSTLRPWYPSHLAQICKVIKEGQKATVQAVAAGPCSHILGLWALPSGHWARHAARQAGIPYSIWTLGSDIWSLGRIPLLRSYLRAVLRGAQGCFSDGIALAEETKRIGGRSVEFLPSTRRIEGRRLEPVRNAPPYRLLFLGRWHPNKGIDLLLDALTLLEEEDWRRVATIDIYGGGPMESLVHLRVQALKAAGRPVECHGFVDKPAAEQAIMRADYLLIPSRVESIPVVYSDAMKLGCPVVCMPVGDMPSLVAGRLANGVVAKDISASAFANALAQALTKPLLDYAAGVKFQAAQFDLNGVVMRLIDELELGWHE